MKRIGRRARILSVVIVYFLACTGAFLYQYALGASDWVVSPANRNIYRDGMLLSPGIVLSADGETLFVSDADGNRYAASAALRKATLHAVGDRGDRIATGVVYRYKANLIGYDLLNGVYNPAGSNATVQLTLNSAVCKAAYEALDGRQGTVGIVNYKTGELLCMVSTPGFDPENVPEDLLDNTDKYEGVFINRLLHGLYVPGSIFKLVTAAAAIDTIPDIFEQTFHCSGSVRYGNDVINCTGKHGDIGFERALAKSCNCAFAKIAEQVGKETLTLYAQKAGLGQRFAVSGSQTAAGRFDVSKAATVELAWAGIGQYTTLVNPMQFLLFVSAIAGGGTPCLPYYVDSVETGSGFTQSQKPGGKAQVMLEKATADTLADMMRNNVKVQYNDSSFSGMELCAKTGTAETSDGKPHAWFTGFLRNSKTPLAFVVILEHADSGLEKAVPVARTVLKEAVKTFS